MAAPFKTRTPAAKYEPPKGSDHLILKNGKNRIFKETGSIKLDSEGTQNHRTKRGEGNYSPLISAWSAVITSSVISFVSARKETTL